MTAISAIDTDSTDYDGPEWDVYQEEIDPDDLYVQHLENLGYWDARAEEDRWL